MSDWSGRLDEDAGAESSERKEKAQKRHNDGGLSLASQPELRLDQIEDLGGRGRQDQGNGQPKELGDLGSSPDQGEDDEGLAVLAAKSWGLAWLAT